VEIAEEIETAARDAAKKLEARRSEVVAELDGLVTEYAPLLAVVRQVRSAVDRADPERQPARAWSTLGRSRERIDRDDVLGGDDLLAIAPPPRQQQEAHEPAHALGRRIDNGRPLGGAAARIGL
jgi:hypothetical protein